MPYTCSCGQQVSLEWQYCAHCGRYAGRVELVSPQLHYQVAAGRPAEKHIALHNGGSRPIAYQANIGPGTQISLVGASVGDLPSGDHALGIRINSVPPADLPLFLHLTTQDGERPEDDPWAPPQPRQHPPVPIRVEAVSAPRLRILPELVILTDARPSRELTLTNEGHASVRVTLPPLPAGMAYGTSHAEHQRVDLEAGASLQIPLALVGPGKDSHSPLGFATDAGQTVPVHVLRHTAPTPDLMPAYIVGIDFGTRNSSVFVRRVGAPGVKEEILPATPGADETARFPSAVYRASDGKWYFGNEAVQYEATDARPGQLIRNIKQFIYDQEEPFLEFGPEFTRRGLLTRFLGYIRQRARDFVSQRWGDELDELEVLYVCSVPLLDEERQAVIRQELGAAVRQAVLPSFRREEPLENWVRFAPEPLCAALYILLDRERVRIRDDERIVVFDSGGGTTDVVMGRVDITNGRVSFEVERQVGLDRKHHTFGGNDVTRSLIDPVLVEDIDLVTNALRSSPDFDLATFTLAAHEPMDAIKIAAVRGDRENADLAGILSLPGVDEELLFVDSSQVDRAVIPFLDPVLDPVAETLFNRDADAQITCAEVDYVFPVGGNTLVPVMRQALRVLFDAPEGIGADRLVLMEEDEVMEAVARGAVRVPDANLKSATPYSLELVTEVGEGKRSLWSLPANAAVHAGKMQHRIPFSFAAPRIRLLARFGTVAGTLAEVEVRPSEQRPNHLCHLQVEVTVSDLGPRLAVRCAVDPEGTPRFDHLLFDYQV